jgi:hypothetical protein
MKILRNVFVFLIIILSNCTKRDNVEVNNKVEVKENYSYNSHDNITEGIIINSTIFDIVDYIFNDLNLKYHYYNLDELLGLLNINNNHTIETRTYNNRHNPDINDYFYNIEGGQYKLLVFHNEIVGYFIVSIEIEINKNNYLNLFPYETINEYLSDNNFGEVYYKVNEEKIMYSKIDSISCYLNFSNNILTSIEIYNGID